MSLEGPDSCLLQAWAWLEGGNPPLPNVLRADALPGEEPTEGDHCLLPALPCLRLKLLLRTDGCREGYGDVGVLHAVLDALLLSGHREPRQSRARCMVCPSQLYQPEG